MIYHEPNKFARSAELDIHEDKVVFHGYQEYTLTKNTLQISDIDLNLKNKQDLLAPYFSPRYLAHRTILDLGANSGFYSFWALQRGAEKVTAVDMDEQYLQMMIQAKHKLGFNGIEIKSTNIMEWDQPADVVIALALVHWIYSCTAMYGSLNAVVKKLRQLTKYMLIVEWIAPEDQAINFFHHIEWNKNIIKEGYILEAFEAALSHYFARNEFIGAVSPTRRLYVAFCSPGEIDLSGPLPFIMNKETIIYSRCITKYEDVEYWSRIYDAGEIIYKQATLDLAEREAYFLKELESNHFPKVIKSWSKGFYSVIILEKIQGKTLRESEECIRSTPEKLHAFIDYGLDILKMLSEKGIMHRDIRSDNILIHNGKPVLIDFGWSISNEHPYITPQGLGCSERPEDGSFSDVYSMGKVFQQVNKKKYLFVDTIIGLMTEDDASQRVTNTEILKVLFDAAVQEENSKNGYQ